MMSRSIYAGVSLLAMKFFYRCMSKKCLSPCNRNSGLPFLKILLISRRTKPLSTYSSLVGEKNIVLMGAPGAGKTTVGRFVGQITGLPVIDVDDDVLEKTWLMSVAKKLQEVGGDLFLEEEGKALQRFSTSGSVLSLTGSNPMHRASMQHMKSNGIVVYLDVPLEDILERLERMKVDRIVGQEPGVSMKEILQYRRPFYHQWYDVRVLCESGESAEAIAVKVLEAVKRYQDITPETFISTRSTTEDSEARKDPVFFSDVVVEGLASDGGLYVPATKLPKLTPGEWQRLVDVPYIERAQVLLELCIHPSDVPAIKLQEMLARAYGQNFSCTEVAPVRHLTGNQFLLELFHGPTASFKDLALQLLPQLFAFCIPRTCNYLILVATSGDTGSAVLDGFSRLSDTDKERISVLTFFPEEGISQIQKAQMISYQDKNVGVIGVQSHFDFCQSALKQIFSNPDYTGFLTVEYGTALSAANSINWARLLPQLVYHASAYLDLISQGIITFGDPVDVCIPTGNFGNVLAAVYAKHMGIPIRKFICASNQNNILTDFIRTGNYDLRHRSVSVSLSPAIDILKSSNLERYLYLITHGDGRLMRELFSQLEEQHYFQVARPLLTRIQDDFVADWCSEEECLAAIYSVYKSCGYILDTHTAVAKVVADRQDDRSCPVIISSTAHPSKFAAAVMQALKVEDVKQSPVDQIQLLKCLDCLPHVHTALLQRLQQAHVQKGEICPADVDAVMDHVESFIQHNFINVL
ncbi:threonine synthase-like 1 [Callorhinchus milii]|nr:threonine synthase-like 1 [Callorhinchus milii]